MSTTPQPKPGQGAPPGENADLAKLQAQIASQTAEITKLKEQKPVFVPQTQPVQTGQPPSKADIEKIFWSDPLSMTDAIARRAAMETEQRIMGSTLENNRSVARDKARLMDTENFDLYEAEVEAKVNGMPPQFQANISTWVNAFNLTKGEHASDIADRKVKAAQGSPQGGGRQANDGPGQPSGKQPPAPKTMPLTEDEKQVVKGMKLTEDSYRRGKERMNNQDVHGPASWDKVITFNSQEARRAAHTAKQTATK